MTLVSIHILQNHAPSNLNRDDNGDPKDTFFGGVRRARISSQALKRSIRWSEHFRSAFGDELMGARTQLLPELVGEQLANEYIDDRVRDTIIRAAMRLGKSESTSTAEATQAADESKKGKKKGGTNQERPKTAQLMFLTTREITEVTQRLLDISRRQGVEALDKLAGDALVKAIGECEPHAIDIAMFGRMTTSSPFKDVEAAVQVAHAISTHAVEQEFDFYTAVDDISGETGAGFLGETAFNSATYYKYFSVDVAALTENLGGDQELAIIAVRALIEAAVFAIPTGKQNVFAAHNLPDLVLVEVRDRRVPLSYANAFVQPIRAGADRSLVEASADELATYIAKVDAGYQLPTQRGFFSTLDCSMPNAQDCTSLAGLLSWLPLEAQR